MAFFDEFLTPSKISPRAPQGRFVMDFELILGSIFHVICDLFENVQNYEIELWLQPGFDFKDLAPSKSLIVHRFFKHFFNLFLDLLLERLFPDSMQTFCEKVRFRTPLTAQLGFKIDLGATTSAKKTTFELHC